MTAQSFDLRVMGFPDHACSICGWRFFTTGALYRHSRGCSRARVVLRERGLAVTALNNSRRVECSECGKVSTPGGLALHQHYSGHAGKVEQT